MTNIQRCAVYNSPVPLMSTFSPRSWQRVALLLAILFVLPSRGLAEDWSTPEQDLARKISAVTGPGAVAVTVVNQSSLGQKEVDQISNGLRSRLEATGVRGAKPEQASASVKISLSENLENYVWVAEIQQGAGDLSVVMVSIPRSEAAALVRDPTALVIHKVPLWTQEQRILDVAVLEEGSAPSHIAVLDADRVRVYRALEGHWRQEQELAIAHTRAWPRDMRGRLMLRQDHLFDIYLPGVFCQSSKQAPLSLSCHESDDPWPLRSDSGQSGFFAANRNFFTGALAPGIGKQASVAKFYSAAAVPRPAYVLWLFTGLDGQVHLLDGMSDQAARWNWGSDIADVKSTCGSGWQVLATHAGNDSADWIRAYEFPDRDPVAVSQPVDFAGAVTALWTEVKGGSAVAVAHNAKTGNYEAFRLSIACGQ
jgi:hypothetical protein